MVTLESVIVLVVLHALSSGLGDYLSDGVKLREQNCRERMATWYNDQMRKLTIAELKATSSDHFDNASKERLLAQAQNSLLKLKKQDDGLTSNLRQLLSIVVQLVEIQDKQIESLRDELSRRRAFDGVSLS